MSDSSFDAGWLELREPVDHRSREGTFPDRLAAEGTRRGWTRILDLGTGTGSNLRYLDPRLPWIQEWTVVDQDPALLARLTDPLPGRDIRRVPGDLGREGLAAISGTDVVTASALLDLVSEGWLQAMVRACAAAEAGALFALTYDGTFEFGTPEPGDGDVRAAVNRHQERDKGLGAALGPSATAVTEALFRDAGYRTGSVDTPWVLEGPADAPLALELVQGWVQAASEVEGTDPALLEEWHRRRRDRIEGGRYQIRVGHQDLLALPSRHQR